MNEPDVDDWQTLRVAPSKKCHTNYLGEPAYDERYDWVEPFYEGLAAVRRGDKWFHIRPDGRPAYAARFSEVWRFSEGLAPVKLGHVEFHIHPDGKPAYARRFRKVYEFVDGQARVEGTAAALRFHGAELDIPNLLTYSPVVYIDRYGRNITYPEAAH